MASSARKPEGAWEAAHALARENDYRIYVEPDIEHRRMAPPNPSSAFDRFWPPHHAVSAGWHLGAGATHFLGAHERTKGRGARIAHLDTGYDPRSIALPRHLNTAFAYDYYADKPGAIDPRESDVGDQPGHGEVTLSLLAGGRIEIPAPNAFSGDIGGAPEAEVIPVRIGPSVIHFYTSTMAAGLDHAYAPLKDRSKRCDVVSISHGGLPSAAWATAVNMLYEDGIIVAAASGDNFFLYLVDVATRFAVYPAAFNRVITVCGVTFDHTPYVTDVGLLMQGNWGPDAVMEKAISAYTPKVIRCDAARANGFSLDGAGTSASTPQVAAACALWIDQYGNDYPRDHTRVDACWSAIFGSASNARSDVAHLGWGGLDAAGMLDAALNRRISDHRADLVKRPVDEVSFPFWRELLGLPPANSDRERMHEMEVAQLVLSSANTELVAAAQGGGLDRVSMRAALLREEMSSDLRQRISIPLTRRRPSRELQ